MTEATVQAQRRLSPTLRRALLTTHVVVSVGLLGDMAAFLAVALSAGASEDPAFAQACYDLLNTFSIAFGIPLSFATLFTGLSLGLGTRWGVLRYPWVIAKLLLIVSVILVGALVLGPSIDELRHGGDAAARTTLLAGAAYNAAALLLATGLSVFKPGRRRR